MKGEKSSYLEGSMGSAKTPFTQRILLHMEEMYSSSPKGKKTAVV